MLMCTMAVMAIIGNTDDDNGYNVERENNI